MKRLFWVLAAGGLILGLCACAPDFSQPDLSFQGFSVDGLPGEFVDLLVDVEIRNTDPRDGNIRSVSYQAYVAGVRSESSTYRESSAFLLPAGKPVNKTMPLRFRTEDALELLRRIERDNDLSYSVDGTFDADTPVGVRTLELRASGSATVEVDLDDFFLQPSVEVLSVTFVDGAAEAGGDIETKVEARITNNAEHAVTVESVRYTVTIEKALVSNEETYVSEFSIGAASAAVTLSDLPASFPVTMQNALAAVALQGMIGDNVGFTVQGLMTLKSAQVGDGAAFVLPLFVEGEAPFLQD